MDYPIRVLQVIGIMNRGGAEAMLMNLYRNIDRTKVQFDFIENTFESAVYDEEIRSLGGKIYNCPHYTGKNHLQYVKWWKNFFKEHSGEYKIIHGHIGSTAAIYLNIAKRNGLYTIAHSHSSGSDQTFASYLYSVISYPTRFIADYFFACSENAGIDRYGIKVTKSDCYSVLSNAIDTKTYKFNNEIRNEVRTEYSLDQKVVIGHIGRFCVPKNHTFLLNIFSAIKKKESSAVLMLVGGGSLEEKIKAKAHELGIFESIIFTGIRSDVSRMVQAMDVFVFPSLFEGLPVTLVEVQTSGLPCVISDKVPAESILIKDLVSTMKLTDVAEQWADHILGRLDSVRRDRSEEIKKCGFDISATASRMEKFYLEKYRE